MNIDSKYLDSKSTFTSHILKAKIKNIEPKKQNKIRISLIALNTLCNFAEEIRLKSRELYTFIAHQTFQLISHIRCLTSAIFTKIILSCSFEIEGLDSEYAFESDSASISSCESSEAEDEEGLSFSLSNISLFRSPRKLESDLLYPLAFENTGQTCYLNSTLQAVLSCQTLNEKIQKKISQFKIEASEAQTRLKERWVAELILAKELNSDLSNIDTILEKVQGQISAINKRLQGHLDKFKKFNTTLKENQESILKHLQKKYNKYEKIKKPWLEFEKDLNNIKTAAYKVQIIDLLMSLNAPQQEPKQDLFSSIFSSSAIRNRLEKLKHLIFNSRLHSELLPAVIRKQQDAAYVAELLLKEIIHDFSSIQKIHRTPDIPGYLFYKPIEPYYTIQIPIVEDNLTLVELIERDMSFKVEKAKVVFDFEEAKRIDDQENAIPFEVSNKTENIEVSEYESCIKIKALPDILAIQLKRFNCLNISESEIEEGVKNSTDSNYQSMKNEASVSLPVDGKLDLSKFCEAELQGGVYDLKGYVKHIGSSLQHGHYISYVKRTLEDQTKFFCCDDDSIKEIAEDRFYKIEDSYLLFFEKISS